VTNPPYGERMGDDREIVELYQSFPLVLRRLPTWSHYILSSRPDLEDLVGQRAARRRKLYNGSLEGTYYNFRGPRPPRDEITRYEDDASLQPTDEALESSDSDEQELERSPQSPLVNP